MRREKRDDVHCYWDDDIDDEDDRFEFDERSSQDCSTNSRVDRVLRYDWNRTDLVDPDRRKYEYDVLPRRKRRRRCCVVSVADGAVAEAVVVVACSLGIAGDSFSLFPFFLCFPSSLSLFRRSRSLPRVSACYETLAIASISVNLGAGNYVVNELNRRVLISFEP